MNPPGTPLAPIVERLRALVAEHGWRDAFDRATQQARQHRVASLAGISSFDDYLRFIDDMVRWAPRECGDSRMVHDKLVEFYFILDQPALLQLQSPIEPAPAAVRLSPLSQWITEYACAWGEYLDTPESAAHIDSFRSNPAFHWGDYMAPPSGYKTFNQFFARHVKPGYRPVAALDAPDVIVAPADAVFVGEWRIAPDSTIAVKGLRWSIGQLLEGSPHAQRFAGGVFTHSTLRTIDYHRWHAPLAGRVLEVRVVRGQAYLDVTTTDAEGGGKRLVAVEGTGYQFVQTRGLVILDTGFGLVACLPVGMGQVASVVITAEVGRSLRKGEEMGYFQFGGSDFVMLFEPGCNVMLSCRQGAHHLQGSAVGKIAP